MISSNVLSIYLLQHNQNKICDQKYLFNPRCHMFRQSRRIKIQACLYGFTKFGSTHQERHT